MRSSIPQIKLILQNNRTIKLCVRQCSVIGDETKLKICFLLRHYPELSVTTIAELVGTSVSNASHSLYKLRTARFVKLRKEGRMLLVVLSAS